MRDRDYAEKFTFSAIKGFLDNEAKRKKRAEAAKTWHSRDRHGKEYSPTSSVAPYRKVPSVSPMQQQPPVRKSSSQPVQHVQTPSMQQIQTLQPVQHFQTPSVQQVEPSPIQQLQPPVESAPEPAPIPAPIEPAPEPAPAPATAHLAAPSAAIPQQMPKPVLSFSVISEISILPMQPSSPQQRQPAVSISPASTFENPTYAIPTSAPQSATQQPPPLTPQRVTYTAAFDPALILAAIPTFILQVAAILMNPKTPQVAVLGCIFYKKGMD